jgi:glutathione S-transferase
LWLLEELKVNYELKIYKREPDRQAPKELKEVHPLGKSPVIGVQGPNIAEPKIIAESAVIVEFLLDHFGKSMIPQQFPAGLEGQIGAETEEWSRYRYFMHFSEGSVMPYLLISTLMTRERLPIISDEGNC